MIKSSKLWHFKSFHLKLSFSSEVYFDSKVSIAFLLMFVLLTVTDMRKTFELGRLIRTEITASWHPIIHLDLKTWNSLSGFWLLLDTWNWKPEMGGWIRDFWSPPGWSSHRFLSPTSHCKFEWVAGPLISGAHLSGPVIGPCWPPHTASLKWVAGSLIQAAHLQLKTCNGHRFLPPTWD